jgi:aminopeptidase N
VVYARDWFDDRTDPNEGDSVVVHELAHQWTGDHLALAGWQHIWLNEGFATYSEWLWSEHEGRDPAQAFFDDLASIPADDSFWALAIGDPGADAIFDGAVYDRGAMTLHALRLKIGDGAFFRLLKEWVRSNAGGNVAIPQFIALAEKISRQNLKPFFQEWLFTPAKPASLGGGDFAARSAPQSAAPARVRKR